MSAPRTSDRELSAALEELAHGGPRRFLVIYDHVPRPDTSGADLRLTQIVELLRDAGHSVVFLGRNADAPRKYRAALEQRGVEVIAPDPERIPWTESDAPSIGFERLLAERAFDVALVYQYFWSGIGVGEQYVPLVRAHSPKTRVWLLSDDCHALREERRFELTRDRDDLERSRALFVREAESYALADELLVITREDAERMRSTWPQLEPQRITFAQDEERSSVPGFDGREGILFLGSGANDANRRALELLVERVLPYVRESLPNVRLRVVGEPPRGGWGYEGREGFEALGRADDLAPHFDRARVFASPITYGTGLKTKNVQALSHGLPLVLTPISAEGLELPAELASDVHDDPRELARSIVALHEDRTRWERASALCREHARQAFGRASTARDLARVLARSLAKDVRTLPAGWVASTFRVDVALDERSRRKPAPRVIAHRDLARELASAGRFSEAASELRHPFCELVCTPETGPVFAELHAQLALVYAAAGEVEEARAAAAAAFARNPALEASISGALERLIAGHERLDAPPRGAQGGDAELEGLRARALEEHARGEIERALETLLSLLARDPRHAGAWNDLGAILWGAGERAEALTAFERALELDPSDVDARENLETVRQALTTVAS